MIVDSSLQIYDKSCDVYLISFFSVAFQLKILKQNKFWCIYIFFFVSFLIFILLYFTQPYAF